MEQNINLLRLFNKDQVNPGDELCDSMGCSLWVYQAGPDTNNNLSITKINDGEFVDPKNCPVSVFRIKPLGWLEGRPVYRGDKVFSSHTGEPYIVTGADCDKFSFSNTGVKIHRTGLTWEEPKKKISGWLNVYMHTDGELTVNWHKTREDAANAQGRGLTTCVPFEVEV